MMNITYIEPVNAPIKQVEVTQPEEGVLVQKVFTVAKDDNGYLVISCKAEHECMCFNVLLTDKVAGELANAIQMVRHGRSRGNY